MPLPLEHTLGELFCGPGGIGLAASQSRVRVGKQTAKISHGWATDYDADTCATFAANISPSVICEDVRKIDFSKLDPVNGLTFGFPCNDFSLVGERRGIDGTFGPLYTYCVKAIDILKPDWFVAENVGGLSSSNEGRAFDQILNQLQIAGEGYTVVPHFYHFEDYGVPQKRHRILIVGIKTKHNLSFRVPAPTHDASNYVTAGEAMANIPDGAANSELTRQASQVVERLKLIRPGENAWTADLPEHLQLNVKGAKLSQIYKRLEKDQPSYTVTGSGGGGTHVYHWEEPRALTNRERARLQTFPDDHIFHGSKESVRKQIGMAVPPAGVQVVFEALLKTLHGVDYPSIEPNLKMPDPGEGSAQRELPLSA